MEEQRRIFGDPFDDPEPAASNDTQQAQQFSSSNDLRSPRKQMFSDLPTPAYNQSSFQSDDTGMVPVNPTYGNYQMAPQGDGGFASLNDALRSPTLYTTTGTGAPTPREMKSKRRESGMLAANANTPHHKTSMSQLREEEGTSF